MVSAEDYLGFATEGEEVDEKQQQAEMQSLIAQLREQGFTISNFVLALPVLLEGTLPTGEEFTLRCRHQKCVLTVDAQAFEQTTRLDGTPFERYEAGGLSAGETAAMLAHLLAQAGYAEAERCVQAVAI